MVLVEVVVVVMMETVNSMSWGKSKAVGINGNWRVRDER
jgi:hypothetical protein